MGEDGGLRSTFTAPSEAERLQARRVHQNTETQLLVKILQERNKAEDATEMGRGLSGGIAEREEEQPLPGRLAAPGTVSCRALFLAFLICARLPAVLYHYPCS